jgi:hypothetical protein
MSVLLLSWAIPDLEKTIRKKQANQILNGVRIGVLVYEILQIWVFILDQKPADTFHASELAVPEKSTDACNPPTAQLIQLSIFSNS